MRKGVKRAVLNVQWCKNNKNVDTHSKLVIYADTTTEEWLNIKNEILKNKDPMKVSKIEKYIC